jgi:hypothetical protein
MHAWPKMASCELTHTCPWLVAPPVTKSVRVYSENTSIQFLFIFKIHSGHEWNRRLDVTRYVRPQFGHIGPAVMWVRHLRLNVCDKFTKIWPFVPIFPGHEAELIFAKDVHSICKMLCTSQVVERVCPGRVLLVVEIWYIAGRYVRCPCTRVVWGTCV